MQLFTPSAAFVESVCNHPRVRPTLDMGTRRLEASNLPVECVRVAFEGGVALFVPTVSGVYDGHVAIHPKWWGRAALRFGRAAVSQLFNVYGAVRLEAVTSTRLPVAGEYCKRLGLKPDGRDLFQEYYSTEAASWAV